jgi:hypothetical protein
MMVTSAAPAGTAEDTDRTAVRAGRGASSAWSVVGVEQLGVHMLRVNAALAQHRSRGLDHFPWPAEEPLVDVIGRHQLVEEDTQPLSIDVPVEELHLLLLARQHVVQGEAFRVPVLEVLELLEEHDVLDRPVAIDQGHRAAWFDGEDGAHDGEDGGDPAARRDHRVRPSAARLEWGVEMADRSHHLHHVAGAQMLQRVGGEDPAGKAFHRHPEPAAAGGAADRVAASDVVAGRFEPERDMLPVGERVVGGELWRNLELDHHGVVGQRLHARDPQGMDGCAPMSRGGLRNRRGGQALSAP